MICCLHSHPEEYTDFPVVFNNQSVTVLKKEVTFFPVHATKAYGGAEIELYTFLTVALDGGAWSTSFPATFLKERTAVPTGQEAGWAPQPVWIFWRRVR
jgi:hypothetical protein